MVTAPAASDVQGMLVAAGFGTRLSPLTDELPKPAVPVANRPLAAYGLDHLAAWGIRDVCVNLHHLGEALARSLTPWVPEGVRLRYVREARILGTGGGVKHAWRRPDAGPFVVMNGKLLFRPDLSTLLARHTEREALATLVLAPMPPGAGFGPIDIDRDGRVRAVLEPALGPGLERCMFTGVYVLHPRAHALLPDEGCVVRRGFVPWLAAGQRIEAVIDRGAFADLGRSLAHYLRGNLDLLEGRLTWPGVVPDPTTASLVDEGAQLSSGCQVRSSAVGAGARVRAASLTRVVVWPGANLDWEGELRDAVVTTAGRVVPAGHLD